MSVWIKMEDGEYNEQKLETSEGMITIYSDHDGEQWSYRLDDGEPIDLEAKDEFAARREALHEVTGR